MERATSIAEAKKILGQNFIGPDELNNIYSSFPVKGITESSIPPISHSVELLSELKNDYLLILGIPFFQDGRKITLVSLRDFFGVNPAIKEPCFYNQDWYLNEAFAKDNTLEFKWYLIDKKIEEETRGKQVSSILSSFNSQESLPSAILTAYCFFAFYFHTKGNMLWRDDFLWCSDSDANGDAIYTGRYLDNKGINKNGFNIHRHLSIKKNYGASKVISGS